MNANQSIGWGPKHPTVCPKYRSIRPPGTPAGAVPFVTTPTAACDRRDRGSYVERKIYFISIIYVDRTPLQIAALTNSSLNCIDAHWGVPAPTAPAAPNCTATKDFDSLHDLKYYLINNYNNFCEVIMAIWCSSRSASQSG
jgi:hypothetical protein